MTYERKFNKRTRILSVFVMKEGENFSEEELTLMTKVTEDYEKNNRIEIKRFCYPEEGIWIFQIDCVDVSKDEHGYNLISHLEDALTDLMK